VANDPRTMLATLLGDRKDLAAAAGAIFDYTQYLLDDDTHLTKGGALDGEGKDLLRARTLELLGGPSAADDDDDDPGNDEA